MLTPLSSISRKGRKRRGKRKKPQNLGILKDSLQKVKEILRDPSYLFEKQKTDITWDIEDKTLIYTYQSPLMLLLNAHKKKESLPNYLIRERVKEKFISVINQKKILAYTHLYLPLKGVLKEQRGMFYLEISSDFKHLTPLLGENYSHLIPISKMMIPVMFLDELKKRPFFQGVNELGMEFRFGVQGCYFMRQGERDHIFFLSIISPQLDTLRERYLLPQTLFPHQYTLSLAIKKGEPIKDSPKDYFRINFAKLQA